jgi:acetyltransferase-like isoleucine patch superfamily enzyme
MEKIVFEDSWQVRSSLIEDGIYIPENSHVNRTVSLESPLELPGGLAVSESSPYVTIGAFTYSWTLVTGSIRSIGRYCSFASQITFGDMEHPTDSLSTSSFIYDKGWMWGAFADRVGAKRPLTLEIKSLNQPIEIGNDVWIGNGAYIKRGVQLGDGCIVGAKAVVTRDVPPYAIVGGNPARIIRYRFAETLCKRLQESRWWDYAFTDFGEDAAWNDVERILDIIAERQASGQLTPYQGKIIELMPKNMSGV